MPMFGFINIVPVRLDLFLVIFIGVGGDRRQWTKERNEAHELSWMDNVLKCLVT